jgi:hypothetical protein
MTPIKKGNFSSTVEHCIGMGETAFKDAHRGLVNCDLNALWDEIVALSNKDPKPTKNKVEKAPQTK